MILIAGVFAGGFYLYTLKTAQKDNVAQVQLNPFKFGLTGNCRKVPAFIQRLNMRAPSLDSKQEEGVMGLQIRDVSQKNKTWQDPSWAMSGYMGAFERDREGNIYVSPMPYVSLLKNPPEKQNNLYKIDANTGKMSLYMTLPAQKLPDSRNPFGVMGLYYDCDTDSLYVSSLAGAEPMQEKGVIYQVDTQSKQIKSRLQHTDAIGVGTFNTPQGKRLYFGSARNSAMYSVPLDSEGRFDKQKKYELSLSQIKGGDSTVIKKIKFKQYKNKYLMSLQEVEFGFRLLAENNPFKKQYHFEFEPARKQWIFKQFTKE